jgi:hypothetical protein
MSSRNQEQLHALLEAAVERTMVPAPAEVASPLPRNRRSRWRSSRCSYEDLSLDDVSALLVSEGTFPRIADGCVRGMRAGAHRLG